MDVGFNLLQMRSITHFCLSSEDYYILAGRIVLLVQVVVLAGFNPVRNLEWIQGNSCFAEDR